MRVCNLPFGAELHCTIFGTPLKKYPDGKYLYVLDDVLRVDWQAVDNWQRQPENDSLRARGDLKWQCACQFTQKRIIEDFVKFNHTIIPHYKQK